VSTDRMPSAINGRLNPANPTYGEIKNVAKRLRALEPNQSDQDNGDFYLSFAIYT